MKYLGFWGRASRVVPVDVGAEQALAGLVVEDHLAEEHLICRNFKAQSAAAAHGRRDGSEGAWLPLQCGPTTHADRQGALPHVATFCLQKSAISSSSARQAGRQ